MSNGAQLDLLEKLQPTLDSIDAGAQWQISSPALRARKCDIYKITASHHTLALKVYKPNMVLDAAPGIQYAALQRCNQAVTNQPILRAPKALAFLPEERAILMEWQPTNTMRTALWEKLGSPNQRLDIVAAAGAWLRAFHGLSDITVQRLDGGILSAKLDTQINRKPASMAVLNNNAGFQTALRHFQQKAAHTSFEAPHALLHGDFTPTNLLVDGAGIIGMDMWGRRRAPVYEDITRMLAYLGVVSPFAIAASPLSPQSALVQAFAKGYGNDLMRPDTEALYFVLLYQQLRRWLVYTGQKNSHAYSPLAQWQLLQNKRLCEQTLNWLDHCKS